MDAKILTTKSTPSALHLSDWLVHAQQTSKRSMTRLTLDVLYFSFFKRMQPKEYFYFALYRPELTRAERNAFVSEIRRKPMISKLIKQRGLPEAYRKPKKFDFANWAKQLDLTTPTTLAYYSEIPPQDSDIPHLADTLAVTDYLLEHADQKIFGKPSNSSEGLGAVAIVGAQKSNGTIELATGEIVSAADLAHEITSEYADGYLFQPFIENHSELRKLFGASPCVFRVNTIKAPGQKAVLAQLNGRFTEEHIMTPNTYRGLRLSCSIDPATKTFDRLVNSGTSHRLFDAENSVTGVDCIGAEVVFYNQMVADALRAHDALGDFPILGWDVIIGETGPVFLEYNVVPNIDFMQCILDKGLLDPEFAWAFK